MALPTGDITLGQVATELGAALPLTMGDSRVRALAGVASGPISLGQLRGKSAYSPPTATMNSSLVGEVAANPGDQVTVSVQGAVTVSGGEAPFSVVWTRTGGSSQISVSGGLNPTFSTAGAAQFVRSATYRGDLTDNRGATTTVTTSVELRGGTPV